MKTDLRRAVALRLWRTPMSFATTPTDTLPYIFGFLALGDLHMLRGVASTFSGQLSTRWCLPPGAKAAPLFSLGFMDDCCLCVGGTPRAECTVVTANRYVLRVFVRDVTNGSRTVVVPRVLPPPPGGACCGQLIW